MFIDSTTKVDNETPNGSNEDITTPYECEQTLISVQGIHKQKQSPNSSQGNIFKCIQMINKTAMASADITSGPAPQRKEKCTLQCALSLKEKKSSWLRAVS
ncbi:hypothetical protein Tco_1163014 [Tanacetum coccineum]